MSAHKIQSIPIAFASLIGAMLMVSSAGYAQEIDADLDKRLRQLEQLQKSDLYSEEEIEEAKKNLLQSIVDPPGDFVPQKGMPGDAARLAENNRFRAYLDRLDMRREDALALRREYNMSRPPARGWLAIRVPFPTTAYNIFEHGWVPQPPIPVPRRDYIVVPTYDPYYDYPYDRNSTPRQ